MFTALKIQKIAPHNPQAVFIESRLKLLMDGNQPVALFITSGGQSVISPPEQLYITMNNNI